MSTCGKAKILQRPGWNPEVERYDDWRYKITLWEKASILAKVKPNERGYRLYDQLKDIKKHSIGEKLLSAIQIGDIDIFGDNGVEQILQTLYAGFKTDDLTKLHQSWRSFIRLQKKKDESIIDFIAGYEKCVIDMKRDGATLPEELYAMQLIDATNIPDKDVKIILTGIDYDKKEEMFVAAKKALRKFLGKEFQQEFQSEREDVYTSESDEVYYSKQNNWRKPIDGYRRGTWRGDRSENLAGQRNYGRGSAGRRNEVPRGRGVVRGAARGIVRGGREAVQRPANSGIQRQTNPMDENGEVQTCRICNSIYHFAGYKGQNCPDSYENLQKAYQTETVNEEALKCDILEIEVSEVFQMEENDEALLDSACSANVMGEKWKNAYIDGLSEKDREEVKEGRSVKSFKFGGEDAVKSLGQVEVPCYLFGEKSTIVADVIDREIPLLISKPEMKKRGFTINFRDETLEVGDMKYELTTTKSGLFRVPLWKVEEVNLMEDKSFKEKVRIIKKMHRQFGHFQEKGMKDLMRGAGELDPEVNDIIEKVVKGCETCLRYKKTPARPVVSRPLSVKWNVVVAMDLKVTNGYFLHVIDLFTRFCRSKYMKDKTPESVVNAFVDIWISQGFGAPKKVLVDNGGEFDNPDYLATMEAYNMEVCATGAYSPWSNGICERNHQVIDVMVQKIKEDHPNMSISLALSNAVSAKNCLQNHNGFTPVQLVTGTLPNLPSVLKDDLPALEEVDENSTCKKHLDAMFAARSAYLKAEHSERIKRALRHPIRSTEKFFEKGERVMFKRDDSNRWKGPGKVIGQSGTVCFVEYGSRLIKVPICRLWKCEGKILTSLDQEGEGVNDEELEKMIEEKSKDQQEKLPDMGNENESVDRHEFEKEGDRRARKKKKTYVPEDGTWKDSTEVKDNSNESEGVNVVFIPKQRHDEPEVIQAKLAEIDNWIKMEAAEVVEDEGQKTMSTRWVITEKENSEGKMAPKARFVLRGFEEADDQVRSDAPTAAKSSLRLALAVAANENWETFGTLDVKAAFLQGKEIEREIYLKPPEELQLQGKLWKLKTTAYGLVDTARAWYLTIREELINLGCKQSGVDRAMFRWYSKGKVLCGLILLHVDDFMSAGTESFKVDVIDKILLKFEFGKQSRMCFKYVGIEMEKEAGGIRIHQSSYVSQMKEVKFSKNGRAGHESLNKEESKQLKALAGQIMWAASQTRPDASFDSLELSMEKNKATVNTLTRANKTVRKLQCNSESGVVYKKLGPVETLRIMVYGDTSYGNLPDGVSSAESGVVFLTGDQFSFSSIDWFSKKIRRKVSSTLEAETLAIRDAESAGIYFGHLLSEIYYDDLQHNRFPVYVYRAGSSVK